MLGRFYYKFLQEYLSTPEHILYDISTIQDVEMSRMTKTLKGSWSEFKDLVREDKRKMDEKTIVQKEAASQKKALKEIERVAKEDARIEQIRQTPLLTEKQQVYKSANSIKNWILFWFALISLVVIVLVTMIVVAW